MAHNDASGIVAGIGCVALLGWLAFWGMILYGLYQLVFNVLPGLAS